MSIASHLSSLDLAFSSVRSNGLFVMGAFHPTANDNTPIGTKTLVLLGPKEPDFWKTVCTAPEFKDDLPNPLDRWSVRVIGDMARQVDGTALFPFDGPPYSPFAQWALRSGRSWQSPIGLLVHDVAGLFASFRGAIALSKTIDLPEKKASPCDDCDETPCLTACPAEALTGDGYDLTSCHSYLDTLPGQACMTLGCAVRRACPVSQTFGRLPVQSEFHMRAFHT